MVGPAVGTAIGLALLLLVGYAVVRVKDRRRRAASGTDGMELSLVESEYSAVGQDAILTRSQVELGRMLGKGEFGKVYSGKIFPSGGGAMVVAAVKEPSAGALADFAEEVDIVCKVRALHSTICGTAPSLKDPFCARPPHPSVSAVCVSLPGPLVLVNALVLSFFFVALLLFFSPL